MAKKRKSLLSLLGPGFISGASDDDPSTIAAFAQTGAQFGYGQLWVALLSFPCMALIQSLCGKIGIVTGQGLSGVLRRHFSKGLLYPIVCLTVTANTVNIGADLGAMADSGRMLLKVPGSLWLLGLTSIITLLAVFVPYRIYANLLRIFALSLFSYIAAACFVHPQWDLALRSTFIPRISFDRSWLLNLVALIGATLTPYAFFWQSDQEVEEEIQSNKIPDIGRGTPRVDPHEMVRMRTDTSIGMFFANLVMFFVMLVTAATLGRHGMRSIETAAQAARALEPLAGRFAGVLFALGILGTGFLSVPVLAGSSSYALTECFDWKAGFHRNLQRAPAFYGVIVLSTMIGVLINYCPVPPFRMLYYTAVLNGALSPFLIVVVLLISNDRSIMDARSNSLWTNLFGWVIAAVATLSAVGLWLAGESS